MYSGRHRRTGGGLMGMGTDRYFFFFFFACALLIAAARLLGMPFFFRPSYVFGFLIDALFFFPGMMRLPKGTSTITFAVITNITASSQEAGTFRPVSR